MTLNRETLGYCVCLPRERNSLTVMCMSAPLYAMGLNGARRSLPSFSGISLTSLIYRRDEYGDNQIVMCATVLGSTIIPIYQQPIEIINDDAFHQSAYVIFQKSVIL